MLRSDWEAILRRTAETGSIPFQSSVIGNRGAFSMRLLLYAASAIFFCAGAQAETITSSQNASLLDGANSYGGLVADSNGNLFGTTSIGGTNNGGTIFRIGADGSGFTTLHSFFPFNEGGIPEAGLVADGNGN